MNVEQLNGFSVRLTLDLSVVVIGGVHYLSDMHQDTINSYKFYHDEEKMVWIPVESLEDFEKACDWAEDHTFIKIPTPESGVTLRQRVNNHFPGFDVEVVKKLW